MITVQEAKRRVLTYSKTLPTSVVKLENALGYILAEDVLACLDLPTFRQSAMDGYAIHVPDINQVSFQTVGEIAAGSATQVELKAGEAVRIFTGAPVPDSANIVVMQEWIDRGSDAEIHLNSAAKSLVLGMNIRPIGEQIKAGNVAIEKGTWLNAAALGFIQSFGYEQISIINKPKIALVITGNELRMPGEELHFGQIYESNSITLKSALASAGFEVVAIEFAQDSLSQTTEKIEKCSAQADVVLVSGGISVGDYDFVKQAFGDLHVEEHFYKIAQKPGKPLFFGTTASHCFFGLPGNPASALVCLYEYVLPALKKMSGWHYCLPETLHLPAAQAITLRGDRDLFLKARIQDSKVHVLDKQASSMLHSFALANALVYLPWQRGSVLADEIVEVHLLS